MNCDSKHYLTYKTFFHENSVIIYHQSVFYSVNLCTVNSKRQCTKSKRRFIENGKDESIVDLPHFKSMRF